MKLGKSSGSGRWWTVAVHLVPLLLLLITDWAVADERGNYVGCFADPRGVVDVMAFRDGSVESCIERCAERYFR